MAIPSSRVHLGEFEVDLRSGELYKQGIKIKLHDQPFKVLTMLLEHPGQLVTREQLHQKLWPADTFVDFDVGLNSAIKRLRDALGDSAESPRFVETLPRRGYRFIAPVEEALAGIGGQEAQRGPAPGSVTPGGAFVSAESKAAALSPRQPELEKNWTKTTLVRYSLLLGGVAAILLALLFGLNAVGLRERLLGRTSTRGAVAGRIRSLAVLPLENLSGDSAQEYFADGMTEALITDLGKIGSLRVISRTSVMHYKGTRKTLPEIARELNVDAVLEGGVLRSANRVRITTQLVEASTDRHLWAESYERDLRDILPLQDDVARAIASEIRIKLTPQEQAHLAAAHTVNPQAQDAYFMGLYQRRKDPDWPAVSKKALGYFEEAIQKDPAWALPYAAKALVLANQGLPGGPSDEKCAEARVAALEALKNDDTLSEAHSAMGLVKHRCDWDWSGGEVEAKRAIELNPSSADAHRVYSITFRALGRNDQAIAERKRALELDPLMPYGRWGLGLTFYLTRHYDEAAEQFRKALEMDADFVRAHIGLGNVSAEKGSLLEAIGEFQKAEALSPEDAEALAMLGYAYGVVGRRKEAENLLHKLKDLNPSPHWVAVVYIGLGRKQDALACLEKAVDTRQGGGMFRLRDDPHFDGLRSDPRFADLLRRLGLAQ